VPEPSRAADIIAVDDAVAVRYLCIFANPRTGSSRLVSLLGSSPDLNSKGELFHKNWIGRLTDRDRQLLGVVSDGFVVDDNTLREWRAREPGRTIEALYESGGHEVVVFKLFPAHLDRELIKAEIVRRPDVVYATLKRRPIESYISGLKAREVGAYGRVDTTSLRPTLKPQHFTRWCKSMRDWYGWCELTIARAERPALSLTYEKHLADADDASTLKRLLDALETIGIRARGPRKVRKSSGPQDRETRYQERVANWPEFETAMRGSAEGASLLDWAETAP
jgi:hypothetical protein